MIILNACSTKKIIFNDAEEFQLFSVDPNPSKDMELHNFGDIIVDAPTAAFLRDYPVEWIRSENKKQLLGVKVEAEESVCKAFLASILSARDGEVLLEDE